MTHQLHPQDLLFPVTGPSFPGWPGGREGFSTRGGSLRLLHSLVGKCFVLLTRSLSCPAQTRQVVARTGWRGRGQSCPNRKLLACCTPPAGLSRLGSAFAAEAEFPDGGKGQSPALGKENRLLPPWIQRQLLLGLRPAPPTAVQEGLAALQSGGVATTPRNSFSSLSCPTLACWPQCSLDELPPPCPLPPFASCFPESGIGLPGVPGCSPQPCTWAKSCPSCLNPCPGGLGAGLQPPGRLEPCYTGTHPCRPLDGRA